MSDSYQQSIRVYELPDGCDTEQLIGVLTDLGWGVDYGSSLKWTAAEVGHVVAAKESFTTDMGRWDELDNIGQLLTTMGCTWSGIVHPAYEYLGQWTAFTPELGTFTGECDDDGNVTMSATEVIKWVDEAASLDELRKRIDSASGRAWEEALAAIDKA